MTDSPSDSARPFDFAHTPFDFTGKVVIITGGSRGVGRGITESFLDVGAEVAICGRREPPQGALPMGPSSRRSPVFVTADVRDAEQAFSFVSETAKRFGRVDVLINNAGGSPTVPAADASPRLVSQVIALNLLAPFFCAQAAYAVMRTADAGGSIVNIGSVSGLRPSPGTAAYGAAKAGLINLTRTLAMEWAPAVRVNCVVAGMIATESALDHYGGAAGLGAVAATVPLRRMGTPGDAAGVCMFLASPLAAYVTGATIEMHGGGEWPPFLAAVEDAQRSSQP